LGGYKLRSVLPWYLFVLSVHSESTGRKQVVQKLSEEWCLAMVLVSYFGSLFDFPGWVSITKKVEFVDPNIGMKSEPWWNALFQITSMKLKPKVLEVAPVLFWKGLFDVF
jgi:hypothetical protein